MGGGLCLTVTVSGTSELGRRPHFYSTAGPRNTQILLASRESSLCEFFLPFWFILKCLTERRPGLVQHR